MAKKACTGLRASLDDQCLPICQENVDYLSQLPEEIMFLIISSFTMKEAARFSLVSRRCEFIWLCAPVLILRDSQAMEKINNGSFCSRDTMNEGRIGFVRKVDRALEKHSGTTIDELEISFDLDHDWQSYVDKWAAFAIDKQVKRLKLNFRSRWTGLFAFGAGRVVVPLSGAPLDLPPKFNGLIGFKSFLNSLSLRDINVTDEFVDHLSHSSPLLEKLCIEGSRSLTRVSGLLQVKHLKVSHCLNLEKLDISARQLQSFKLYSHAIELRIADAASLAEMSIGTKEPNSCFAYAFDSLSEHFSQLVYLKLMIPIDAKMKKTIDRLVAMPNLKHLVLEVRAMVYKSIQKWIPVIAASPSLQKLTLKLLGFGIHAGWDLTLPKWVGFPLKCLKTLELSGYVGLPIDLELAVFVFENASMLEEVIVDFDSAHYYRYKNDDIKQERLVRLQKKLPQGVKLTVN